LTKIHEEFIRGTIPEVIAVLAARKELLGEATVVLAPHFKDWELKPEND
jgi:16S rRNA C1402 (ribose-2'-O) methylase RsmI